MLEKLLEPARARIILACLIGAAATCLAASLIIFMLAIRLKDPQGNAGETARLAAGSLLDYWALGFLIAVGLMGVIALVIMLRGWIGKGAGR